jgi:tRNA-2-methylthio-N6-dimethylallyladenosine synthase
MKYFVRTYGCQMNVADSNEMSRHFEARGLVSTDDPDDASVFVVNTCTVRQHAEDRALSEIGRLRRWKDASPDRKVIVTGCAAERTRAFIEHRFPYVDLVVGAKAIDAFGQIVDSLLAKNPSDESVEYASGAPSTVSSFVTIMRGCNYSCTYCIVPYVRGREIYRPMDEVIDEARERVGEGVKDVTLLGQTVNSYHRDSGKGKGTDFADLLEAVAGVDGVERVRFISPHPFYMTDRVIEAMATVPEVCESLHLPVQSGSNTMLDAMRRNYTRERYLDLLASLRSAMPDIVLSTDVIVGFPGETDDDFDRTLSLLEEARFDWGFIFKYSTRQGTPAAELVSHPESLVEERHRVCLDRVERIGLERRRRLLGTRQEVLVEGDNTGRTRGNYKLRMDAEVPAGRTAHVEVTSADRATLEGRIVPESAVLPAEARVTA